MIPFQLFAPLWKWFVCCLALLSAFLLATEFTHAIKPLKEGVHGSLGVVLTDQTGANQHGQGTYRLRIESLEEDSPLKAERARVGDTVRFDRYADRFRILGRDEKVGLTLYQGATQRPLTLKATAKKISFAEYFDYCGRFLLSVPALLFGLIIAFKQSEGRTYRALSITFIMFSTVYFYGVNYSPDDPVFGFSKFVHLVTGPLIWYGCAAFALAYQPYAPSPLRTAMRRLFPWFRVLAFGTAIYTILFALGMETPYLWIGALSSVAVGLTFALVSLVAGWGQSSGEIRQRHLWLLLSFALGTIPALLTRIPALDAFTFDGLRITVMMFFAGQLLMFIGLTYAVLRYRVFNFDFALSRALVFGVVSLLLLSVIWAIERQFGSHEPGFGASLLALVTYLVLHMVHEKLKHGVEHVFFKSWQVNEGKLRAYVRQAAHITTTDTLLSSFRNALDRFTGHAGCAIYLREGSGAYARASSTLEGAPASVDRDDIAAVALRTEMKLMFIEQMQTALQGELVLPMCHRGILNGFVLIGSKPRGESYRPDECDALAYAANQVGLDLHALRVDTLEHELRELERETVQQKHELQLMAGRRRSVRAVPESVEAGPAAIV